MITDRQCLVDKNGTTYTGQAAPPPGVTCVNWSDVTFLGYSLSLLPDGNLTESSNNCRLIPGLGWEKPSCYNQEMSRPYQCPISYCGKCHHLHLFNLISHVKNTVPIILSTP